MSDSNAALSPEESNDAGISVETDRRASLRRVAESGASWFYWIAALSLINTAAALLMKSDLVIIVGLAITQIVDGITLGILEEVSSAPLILAIGFAVNCAFASGFVALGWRAKKLEPWAFKLGFGIYATDAAVFLLFGDWISVGFHAFVLTRLWSGLKAAKAAAEPSRVSTVAPAAETSDPRREAILAERSPTRIHLPDDASEQEHKAA